MKGLFWSLIVLFGIAAGVAFSLHWWNLSRTSTDDKTRISLTVDKERARQDIEALKHKAEEIKEGAREKAAELPGRQTMEGTLASVDRDNHRVAMQLPDQLVVVEVPLNATIKIGDRPAELSDLEPGMRAHIVHTTRDGLNTAKSVTVVAPK
jgi:hypothetical protein